MIINGERVGQIVITREGSGSLVTEDGQQEVIAILSDDGEWIVKNGYKVEFSTAQSEDCCGAVSYFKQRDKVISKLLSQS